MLKEKIILASKSPRRAEILSSLGWEFESHAANIDESRLGSEDAVTYVKRLAQQKATKISERMPDNLVLGADTVVVIDGEILGQPRDDNDARRMLTLLSGKWHEVLTGVALIRGTDQAEGDYEKTRVRFAELSVKEIDWYVATGEPKDKAGAYGIQGRGAIFIQEIEGDYFNIVGLPVRLIYTMLESF